jgi:hypothetical protein
VSADHAGLVGEILGRAGVLGYWCWADRHSLFQAAGWIDLVILGHRRAWFVEVKSADGRRSRQQVKVARLLKQAGLDYRLIRPDDLTGFTTELEEAARCQSQ